MTSAQSYVPDPRNASVVVYVNGAFVPRNEARVSIFDAGFGLGDGVWEGLRLVDGRLICIDEHLDRLYEGANAIRIDIGLSRDAMKALLSDVLARNGMRDGAHVRLMVTRGVKSTVNQDPRFTVGPATIVVVAEYKQPNPAAKDKGLSLWTSTIRCSNPDVFDLRLNSHSRLNLIQALIQAIDAGADEALMLDGQGFVASCNSTNFFVVRRGELWTSTGRCNFKGITRGKIVGVARDHGMPVHEKDYTLAETWSADEAFVTGTLGGVTPVTKIDGRTIGDGRPGAWTLRIAEWYRAATSGSTATPANDAKPDATDVQPAAIPAAAATSNASANDPPAPDHDEWLIDESVLETFPASDPVAPAVNANHPDPRKERSDNG